MDLRVWDVIILMGSRIAAAYKVDAGQTATLSQC